MTELVEQKLETIKILFGVNNFEVEDNDYCIEILCSDPKELGKCLEKVLGNSDFFVVSDGVQFSKFRYRLINGYLYSVKTEYKYSIETEEFAQFLKEMREPRESN